MTIAEMHVMFRQFAQQMGMQNVRAILPEQIDLLINTSIGDTVNQLIRSTVGVTNDRIITDNSKILQINSLKTLYKVKSYEFTSGNGFSFRNRDHFMGKFNVDLSTKQQIGGGSHDTQPVYANVYDDFLFLVDFAVNYAPISSEGSKGWANDIDEPILKQDEFITNPYPVRVIDDAFLADTLNDFLLKPCLRSPVMTIVNNNLDIYFGEMKGDTNGYTLENNLSPYELRMSYIAKPRTVKYLADITGDSKYNADCDLPDNLHIDIVKHAVELYLQIAGRSVTPQEQGSQANTGETTTPQQRQ